MKDTQDTLYANVIVDISHESVDRAFQYAVPREMEASIRLGSAVMIPFGRGNKLIRGYVVKLSDAAEWDPDKIKRIALVMEDETGPEADAIRLAAWMRKRYGSTMITALKTVLPVKQRIADKIKKTVVRTKTAEDAGRAARMYEEKHQSAKARLMREMAVHESLPYELAVTKLRISLPTLRALEKSGEIRVLAEKEYRGAVHAAPRSSRPYALSEEQRSAADRVIQAVRNRSGEHFLLHGITGSGKTEVYLEIVEHTVREGRQAIVLIPEIALTYQTVMRFYQRFGQRVSVVNSRLSAGERYDQYERAKNGMTDVVIGPRSALFTPFQNLGVIIIDEEHETSYKSENMPKYHAREVAFELASYHRASVLLGSATPSLEAYYMAETGKLTLLRLTKRLTGTGLPRVSIVDLREELRLGNRSMLSDRLEQMLSDRLERGEQSMLFLNRRGMAGFVSCRACGHVMRCPHCDVSLTQHRGGRLVCHYCGYEQPGVTVCPECGSKYILGFKAGTQQVEDAVKKVFPQARVLRMDADTTRKKDSYDEILSAFSGGEADILVGTQMIVKGHDFPRVTLVGILAADLSLGVNDYRAGERTFDLLTQAAGRAGRGTRPGEVVIQTYQPDHYAICYAAAQDYEGFYRQEIAYREFLCYPPVGHLLAVQVHAQDEEAAGRLAEQIREHSQERAKAQGVLILGPAQAAVRKVKDIFRQVLYYKHRDTKVLEGLREMIEQYLEGMGGAAQTVLFDMDPIHFI